MEEVCSRCGTRKPSRFCPTLRERICARCCGKNRHKRISCDEECHFLIEAQAQAMKRLLNLAGDGSFEAEAFEVLHNLRMVIVKLREARYRSDLSEDEVLNALSNAINTRRAQARGVIYEFRSPNHRVQEITEGLMMVGRWYEKGEKGLSRVEPDKITECLEYLRRQAQEVKDRGVNFLDLWGECVQRKLLIAN